MENKKNYYKNNKKHYYKKKNNDKKITYDKLVNIRNDANEIENNITSRNNSDNLIINIIAVSIIVLAIVFSSLLLLHLI